MDISPHEIHVSECLSELSPGDHIEVQWRRSQKFPCGEFLFVICQIMKSVSYCFFPFAGWWYGVIGHLDSCDGDEQQCLCNLSGEMIPKLHSSFISSQVT